MHGHRINIVVAALIEDQDKEERQRRQRLKVDQVYEKAIIYISTPAILCQLYV